VIVLVVDFDWNLIKGRENEISVFCVRFSGRDEDLADHSFGVRLQQR
jgi:hypothetical protein